ncbi:3598_t:CDS:2, partial [Ambispora leptoticha]
MFDSDLSETFLPDATIQQKEKIAKLEAENNNIEAVPVIHKSMANTVPGGKVPLKIILEDMGPRVVDNWCDEAHKEYGKVFGTNGCINIFFNNQVTKPFHICKKAPKLNAKRDMKKKKISEEINEENFDNIIEEYLNQNNTYEDVTSNNNQVSDTEDLENINLLLPKLMSRRSMPQKPTSQNQQLYRPTSKKLAKRASKVASSETP